MRATYDASTDTLELLFRVAPVAESDELRAGIFVGYDGDGELVRLTIQTAARRVDGPTMIALQVVPQPTAPLPTPVVDWVPPQPSDMPPPNVVPPMLPERGRATPPAPAPPTINAKGEDRAATPMPPAGKDTYGDAG